MHACATAAVVQYPINCYVGKLMDGQKVIVLHDWQKWQAGDRGRRGGGGGWGRGGRGGGGGKVPGVPFPELSQELSHLRRLTQPFFIFIGPLSLYPGGQACTHLHSFTL